MGKIIVSTTGLSKQSTDSVARKVAYFGKFTDTRLLHNDVTHLVVPRIYHFLFTQPSNKLIDAGKRAGIEIVIEPWADAVLDAWRKNSGHLSAKALHEITKLYRAPSHQTMKSSTAKNTDSAPKLAQLAKNQPDLTLPSHNLVNPPISSEHRHISVFPMLPDVPKDLFDKLSDPMKLNIANFAQLSVPHGRTRESITEFESGCHMLQCLSLYQIILIGRYSHTAEVVAGYTRFMLVLLGLLDGYVDFSVVKQKATSALENFFRAPNDYTFANDIGDLYVTLFASDVGALDAALENSKRELQQQKLLQKQQSQPQSQQADTVKPKILCMNDMLEAFFQDMNSSETLCSVLDQQQFIDLFHTSNQSIIVKCVSSVISRICCSATTNLWHDQAFWNLMQRISAKNIDPLMDELIISLRILDILAEIECLNLDSINLDMIYEIFAVFLSKDHRKSALFNVESVVNRTPHLLLISLRNGATPIVSFMTNYLGVPLSRKLQTSDAECPWALLQTARSGTYEMFLQLSSSGDMGRVYDSTDELTFSFLKKYNPINKGMKEPPGWKINLQSVALMNASFGNPDIFFLLLESLNPASIKALSCRVEIEWKSGSGNKEILESASQFELALLGGYLQEAKLILEFLLKGGFSRGDLASIYSTVLLTHWICWMTDCHSEPAEPTIHKPEDKIHDSTSEALVKNILSLLGDEGILSLTASQWPVNLPSDLYARGWISSGQMLYFIESSNFDPLYILPKKTSLLCWTAWNFDIEILESYLPLLRSDYKVLQSETTIGKESWLHLLSGKYLKNSKNISFLFAYLFKNPAVILAVDATGVSVKECWLEVQRKAGEQGNRRAMRDLKNVLSYIEDLILHNEASKSIKQESVNEEPHNKADQDPEDMETDDFLGPLEMVDVDPTTAVQTEHMTNEPIITDDDPAEIVQNEHIVDQPTTTDIDPAAAMETIHVTKEPTIAQNNHADPVDNMVLGTTEPSIAQTESNKLNDEKLEKSSLALKLREKAVALAQTFKQAVVEPTKSSAVDTTNKQTNATINGGSETCDNKAVEADSKPRDTKTVVDSTASSEKMDDDSESSATSSSMELSSSSSEFTESSPPSVKLQSKRPRRNSPPSKSSRRFLAPFKGDSWVNDSRRSRSPVSKSIYRDRNSNQSPIRRRSRSRGRNAEEFRGRIPENDERQQVEGQSGHAIESRKETNVTIHERNRSSESVQEAFKKNLKEDGTEANNNTLSESRVPISFRIGGNFKGDQPKIDIAVAIRNTRSPQIPVGHINVEEDEVDYGDGEISNEGPTDPNDARNLIKKSKSIPDIDVSLPVAPSKKFGRNDSIISQSSSTDFAAIDAQSSQQKHIGDRLKGKGSPIGKRLGGKVDSNRTESMGAQSNSNTNLPERPIPPNDNYSPAFYYQYTPGNNIYGSVDRDYRNRSWHYEGNDGEYHNGSGYYNSRKSSKNPTYRRTDLYD